MTRDQNQQNISEPTLELGLNMYQAATPDTMSCLSELIRQHNEYNSEVGDDGSNIIEMILESVCSGVLLIDAESRTVVYANDAAARLMGASKGQIIGQACNQHTCSTEWACPVLDQDESIHQSERILITADGKKIPIIKTVVPIQWHDKAYLVESFTDITRLKEAQTRQDKLMDKLERMNKELTDFSYIVSHDLKAPLRGIKSLAHWIVSDHFDTLNDDGKEQLSLLQNRVDRMQDLVKGILEYSLLGQASERMTEVDLDVLLPNIVDMVATPDNVSVDIQKSLPTLQCQKTRISQVFQNLLSNAVKYMDKPQGKIEVRCIDEGEHWQFSISDNGPGIDKTYQDKIFQLFQTVLSKDQTDSTGIGLSVVKKCVTMYGGQVWVESEIGQGSTFYFTFPKAASGV